MSDKLSFQQHLEITRKSIEAFEQVEQRSWGIDGSMIELSKQVGDLAKHVMVQEKYYLQARESDPYYQTGKANIADELADVFYCLVRIADHYSIDLEQSLLRARHAELDSLGIKSSDV